MLRKRYVLSLLAIAATFFVSPCAAQQWKLLNPVLSHTIVVNPQNPRSLTVGNWANQIYRSWDAGRSWYRFEIGSTDVLNFITSLAISHADTNVMLAGGFSFDGIRRSTDGGATWNRALNDTTGNGRMWFVSEAIIEAHDRPGTFYAARGTTNNGIWRSTNNGATWDSISVISRGITQQLCTIAQRPDSGNVFFLGVKGGRILRSDDRCSTWRPVPVLNGATGIKGDAEIPKIVFSREDPRIGYAVVSATSPDSLGGNGGVLATLDGGSTWERVGFTDTSFWSVEVTDVPTNVVVGGFRISNRPTVLVGDGLIFASTTGGDSWDRFDDIVWGRNELDDTLRNAWVLRYEPILRKLYLAAGTGTFVYDVPVSVDASTITEQHATLHCNLDGTTLIVRDASPMQTGNVSWALYTMQGQRVAYGQVTTSDAERISMASLPQGRYLLTWGDERRFRTAHITLVR